MKQRKVGAKIKREKRITKQKSRTRKFQKDRKNWKTPEDVMAWWVGDQPYREEETLFSKYE